MRVRASVCLLVCFSGLLSACDSGAQRSPSAGKSAQQSSAGPYSNVRMRLTPVMDNTWFEAPMPSAHIMAPVDWKFNSATMHLPRQNNKAGCTIAPFYQVSMLSPDGMTGLNVIPGQMWIWGNTPAMLQQLRASDASPSSLTFCTIKEIPSAVDYLKKDVLGPNAATAKVEVLDSGPIPGVEQQVQQRMVQLNAQSQQAMGPRAVRYSAETGQLHLRGVLNGKPTEGYLQTVLLVTSTPTPSGMYQQVTVPMVLNKFAPAGQLPGAIKLLDTIATSIVPNPEYQARIADTQQKMAGIQNSINQNNADTAQNIARIHADTQNYAAKVYSGVNASRSQASHQAAYNFGLSMNDTQEYHDPSTGKTVIGSNQYNHVYSNGQGEYIYSNSPTYDPNATERGNWQAMQPQQ